jgi:TolB-like protein
MSFFEELKRRNVVRVGIAYAAIGWVLAQVAEFAFENFGAPEWVLRTFVMVLVLGLPLALFFAWAFEMTPEGLKREKDVDRSRSITKQTGRKLDRVIIGVLVLATGFLLADKFLLRGVPGGDGEIVATGGRQSIAVLPFVNMSDDSDHFSDGLSEELLNLLAKSPDLKVAGRTSSFAFKGRNEDLREIGDALGVEHVLEGSVRRSGDRLRITAQLIKVDDGFPVWSDTYDREMADIFDIQDDVAGAIAENLRLRLAPESDRPTDNVEAYSLYLQAVALQSSADAGDIVEAQQLLNRATQLDPSFARAYELQASYYWYQGGWMIDNPQAQSMTYAAAMKALELDATLTTARSYAQTAKPDWNWIDEIAALEEVARTEPNNINALNALSYDLMIGGYFNEAIRIAEQLIEYEPLSPVGYWRMGEALMAAGRREAARENLRHAADVYDARPAIGWLANAALLEGDDDEAIEWIEKLWSSNGRDPSAAGSFVTGVRDPEGGKVYLDDWIAVAVANAADLDERLIAYAWYLPFGYLDDYWDAIHTLSDGVVKGWTNADTLEQGGMILRHTGFARHPEYLPRSIAQGLTDLWDMRGAPDHCTKASGAWVCE